MRSALLLLVVLLAISSTASACSDGTLIEYAYGGFSEGSIDLGPRLYPPLVKIYADGRIVFYEKGRFWMGTVPDSQLARFKSKLAKNRFLSHTRLVPIKRGSVPGIHGGMSYIRYCHGKTEVLLGAFLHPAAGPWGRLLAAIRRNIPSTRRSYTPAEAVVWVTDSLRQEATPWPYKATLDLAQVVGDHDLQIDDRQLLAALFTHLESGFSWMEAAFRQDDRVYKIILESVPGWYEPSEIRRTLGELAVEAEAGLSQRE